MADIGDIGDISKILNAGEEELTPDHSYADLADIKLSLWGEPFKTSVEIPCVSVKTALALAADFRRSIKDPFNVTISFTTSVFFKEVGNRPLSADVARAC